MHVNFKLVAQWFNLLAAMAILSARTWVRVQPITNGVFQLHSTPLNPTPPNAKICAMCPNNLAQSYQGHMSITQPKKPLLLYLAGK